MIKRWIYYTLAIVTVCISSVMMSCREEVFFDDSAQVEVPEGYKLLSFTADVPDMVEVNTRAIDPDGGGIQDLWLFCFTGDGYFLSTVKAEIMPADGDASGVNSLSGEFTASVPEATGIVHFIANYRMISFDENAMLGKHETDLIPSLVVSSGYMIYWQRMQLPETGLENLTVTLIRNQAQFRLATPIDETTPKIVSFGVYNTSAYGTVAPYNADAENKFKWDSAEGATSITLPAEEEYQVRLRPVVEQNNASTYVFETENTEKNPVSIVLEVKEGEKSLYYRALVLDGNENFLNIRRNNSYVINVTGTLKNGKTSVEEALNSSPVNNVWISIADNIRTISDGKFELSVENTVFVYETGQQQSATIKCTYKRVSGSDALNPPAVSWLENNELGTELDFLFTEPEGNVNGTITFKLNQLSQSESVRTATILVKAGVLQRKIRIYLIKKFDFIPAWVSTQVNAQQADEPVTLMFMIPEDFPQELFPFDVKIGAEWLNVREAAGQVLSIITPLSHPDDFAPNDEYTFKFLYRAERAGVQRVYFNTTLPPTQITGEYDKANVRIEADYFNPVDKEVSFNPSSYFISLSQLLSVDGGALGGNMPKDDQVYYRLVPRKKNAFVSFQINTKTDDGTNGGSPVEVGVNDEFLIFTNYLTYYTDSELEGLNKIKECDFLENPVSSTMGSGYYQAFKPLKSGKSQYNIYMKTTRTASEEVIRIASPESGMESLFNSPAVYSGQYFRSITFELANYRPFSFYASVTDMQGNRYQNWTYEPDQPIDVEFDVTSFRGGDNRSADPFGTQFKVYIDAPMLDIDESRRGAYTVDRFYEESEGRFVLVMDADRENNRLGTDDVNPKNEDKDNGVSFDNYEPDPLINQTKEHHVLPFIKRSIVSEGQIVISAEEEIVSFDTEMLEISNAPITGTLVYGNPSQYVPENSFVSISLKSNGTRIGAMEIGNNGSYFLNLRQVYDFNWVTDPVVVAYKDTNSGVIYIKEFQNLKTLFEESGSISLMATE